MKAVSINKNLSTIESNISTETGKKIVLEKYFHKRYKNFLRYAKERNLHNDKTLTADAIFNIIAYNWFNVGYTLYNLLNAGIKDKKAELKFEKLLNDLSINFRDSIGKARIKKIVRNALVKFELNFKGLDNNLKEKPVKIDISANGNIDDFLNSILLVQTANEDIGILVKNDGNVTTFLDTIEFHPFIYYAITDVVLFLYTVQSNIKLLKNIPHHPFDDVEFCDYIITHVKGDDNVLPNGVSYDIDNEIKFDIHLQTDKEFLARAIYEDIVTPQNIYFYKQLIKENDEETANQLEDYVYEKVFRYVNNGLLTKDEGAKLFFIILSDLEGNENELIFDKWRLKRLEKRKQKLMEKAKTNPRKRKKLERVLLREEKLKSKLERKKIIREKRKEKRNKIKELRRQGRQQCGSSFLILSKKQADCWKSVREKIKDERKKFRELVKSERGMSVFNRFIKRVFPPTAIMFGNLRASFIGALRSNLWGYASVLKMVKEQDPERYKKFIDEMVKKIGFDKINLDASVEIGATRKAKNILFKDPFGWKRKVGLKDIANDIAYDIDFMELDLSKTDYYKNTHFYYLETANIPDEELEYLNSYYEYYLDGGTTAAATAKTALDLAQIAALAQSVIELIQLFIPAQETNVPADNVNENDPNVNQELTQALLQAQQYAQNPNNDDEKRLEELRKRKTISIVVMSAMILSGILLLSRTFSTNN
ncbi:MAG: hypothetical protein KatS3mg096_587 [Candidatus Parcubacteria bacterium]|nr:MAG: hypothetical protein KatS3mg096_587 [Candidatus Parcubacteria bacterium]